MLRLLLLRHAKSDWPEGVDDVDRPLTLRGAAQARDAGAYIREHGLIPDRAIVSIAQRTRETWDAVVSSWTETPSVAFESDVYAASARRLLQVVREHGGEARSLLLVGHNPGVHDLVATLSAERDRIPLAYPTATLAVLELPVDGWSEVDAGTARVERVVVKGSE